MPRYEDDTFDIVLSLNGFHAFPDKEAAYREVFRVLRPGGTILRLLLCDGRAGHFGSTGGDYDAFYENMR